MNTKIISAIALLLMLFAMILYVVSDDEAIPPVAEEAGVNGPAATSLEVPAADGPAAE